MRTANHLTFTTYEASLKLKRVHEPGERHFKCAEEDVTVLA